MFKINRFGNYVAIALLVMCLNLFAGETPKDETVIKIGNHFFKESGGYRPSMNGLVNDRCSIISVDERNEFTFINKSTSNDHYRVFNAPSQGRNIWASGSVGDVGAGMPFVWMSRRVDSGFLSISFFYAWQVHFRVTKIDAKLSKSADSVIIIPKPSTEIESVLILAHNIESGKVSFPLVPGEYLLLFVTRELDPENPETLRFTVFRQMEVNVVNPDPGSLSDEVSVERKFSDLKESFYTAKEIERSSPWLLDPKGNRKPNIMTLEINSESVKAFDLCK
jgi:hypothetical protein